MYRQLQLLTQLLAKQSRIDMAGTDKACWDSARTHEPIDFPYTSGSIAIKMQQYWALVVASVLAKPVAVC